jgi:hypothetical protein
LDFGTRSSRAALHPAGILKYVDDLKREPNAEIEPKGIFEIASVIFCKDSIAVQQIR